MGTASRARLGTASALIATQRQVGIAVGMAVAGTLFSARRVGYHHMLTQKGIDGTYAADLAIPLAFHDVLLMSIFISAIVVILCLVPGWRNGRKAALA